MEIKNKKEDKPPTIKPFFRTGICRETIRCKEDIYWYIDIEKGSPERTVRTHPSLPGVTWITSRILFTLEKEHSYRLKGRFYTCPDAWFTDILKYIDEMEIKRPEAEEAPDDPDRLSKKEVIKRAEQFVYNLYGIEMSLLALLLSCSPDFSEIHYESPQELLVDQLLRNLGIFGYID